MRRVSLWALPLFTLIGACGGAPPEEPAAAPVASSPPPSPPPAPEPQPAPVAAPPHAAAHWSYSGDEGPARWGDLAPEFVACKAGEKQTPIDLPSKAPRGGSLGPLAFAYSAMPLVVAHNGHTVQATAPAGGSVTANGARYGLLQFHVHAPSEHTLDGKRFDAELHLVHKNDAGELAVVGVLLRRGKESRALAPFLDHLPSAPTKEPVVVAGTTVDVASMFPAKARYLTYAGSLTTPPCSEGVTWLVLADPQEVSEAQLAKIHAALPGDTNRPIQPTRDRKVEQFRP